jgi:hypothetical protein
VNDLGNSILPLNNFKEVMSSIDKTALGNSSLAAISMRPLRSCLLYAVQKAEYMVEGGVCPLIDQQW